MLNEKNTDHFMSSSHLAEIYSSEAYQHALSSSLRTALNDVIVFSKANLNYSIPFKAIVRNDGMME